MLINKMKVSQKVKKGLQRHAGLDPASLYFQTLPDSGLRRNDENRTFCDVIPNIVII